MTPPTQWSPDPQPASAEKPRPLRILQRPLGLDQGARSGRSAGASAEGSETRDAWWRALVGAPARETLASPWRRRSLASARRDARQSSIAPALANVVCAPALTSNAEASTNPGSRPRRRGQAPRARDRSRDMKGSRTASAADATVETLRGRYQLCARGSTGFEADEVVVSADRKRDVRVRA